MERKRRKFPPKLKRKYGIPLDELPLPFGFREDGTMISLKDYLELSPEEKEKIAVAGVKQNTL
ncbi:MAG: hypothetical protein RIQ54_298 [Candidatus Parcubacteria bacterium]|jgi:hypothetical protein